MKSIIYILLFTCSLLQCFSSGFKINKRSIDLTSEDLNFFFGDSEPPNYSFITIRTKSREKRSIDASPSKTDPGYIDITLNDEHGEVEFELHPNTELISSNFKLVVRGHDGVIESETKGKSSDDCIYVGNAKGHPNAVAALSTCDGKGFTGILIDGDDAHLIRPLNNNSRPKRDVEDGDMTPDGLHIIYTQGDRKSKCGIHNLRAMTAPRAYIDLSTEDEYSYYEEDAEMIMEQFNDNDEKEIVFLEEPLADDKSDVVHHIQKRQLFKEKFIIETAVFVDDVMYKIVKKRNDGNEKKAIKDVDNIVKAIINGVALMYNAPSLRMNVKLLLVRLDILKEEPKGMETSEGEITRYLLNFCAWQRRQNEKLNPEGDSDPDYWDHGLLLTGINLWEGKKSYDAVIGLAWVAGMCTRSYSCTINEGTSFEAVYVIAHEMGHNLNMTHDGSAGDGNNCPNNTYLMSPSTGPGKVTWSVCSNRELERFLESGSRRGGASCLRDIKRNSKGINFSPKQAQPGELYDIKKQCLYALGTKFAPYVTSKHPYNNVCRELWCQNKTHALRTHPALEGSRCDGITKHCTSGICVTRRIDLKFDLPDVSDNEIDKKKDPSKEFKGRSKGYGLRDLLLNIRNMFHKYYSITKSTAVTELPEWQLHNWTSCSVSCGGGWQTSKIVCIEKEQLVSDSLCSARMIPSAKSSCNTLPCKKSP